VTGSANVRSIEAVREFRAGVVQFQDDSQIVLNTIRQQLLRAQQWLEQECPQYWRMEIQKGFTRVAEARGRLDACRRRRLGDFKPSCFEEQEAFRREQRKLEIARWANQFRQEFDEFQGRSGQLESCLLNDMPKLIALLDRISQTLEAYAEMTKAPLEGTVNPEPLNSPSNEQEQADAENR